MKIAVIAALILVLIVVVVLFSSVYTVDETQQVIITRFGEPVGPPVTTPGWKFKTPFLHEAHYLDKDVVVWENEGSLSPTRDGLFLQADACVRWRISDPLVFFKRVRTRVSAETRLDDILDGETRQALSKHDLVELQSEGLCECAASSGRTGVEAEARGAAGAGAGPIALEVLARSRQRVDGLGIEILGFCYTKMEPEK